MIAVGSGIKMFLVEKDILYELACRLAVLFGKGETGQKGNTNVRINGDRRY